ncbi:hypothetical protein [Dysgonomonas sp. ZJ279]|uniref:hypothetical protein n=1 Tax=Dysgonomonas sp. ZJ279 TaxID=2709796 RepID=UPI0013EA50D9|nr:hypothetical protein [Dysgonomonas sp. ZJ279]
MKLMKIEVNPLQEFSNSLNDLFIATVKWSVLLIVIVIMYHVVKKAIKDKWF